MRRSATSTWLRSTLALACWALLAACGDAPRVLQGTVVGSDDKQHTISVRDELAPHAVVELAIARAEISAKPAPGDLVRAAYREQGGVKTVSRLMNLTRQAELRRGGGGH